MDLFERKGVSPMLIAEQVEPYDDSGSIFELKLDGCRCIAYCDRTGTDMRNKRDRKLLPQFPELEELHLACRKKCILDGELIVPINGKPDFYQLQKRTMLTDPFKISLSSRRQPAKFVAYDILYADGKELMGLPLMERKGILEQAAGEGNGLSISRYVRGQGRALFAEVAGMELEGVVGKKMDSLYWLGKRTKDWKKVKRMADEDLACVGYIRKGHGMTSLVLARYDEDGRMEMAGHVTLGVSMAKIRESGIREGTCPLDEMPKGHEDVVWLEPSVCTIEYMPSEGKGYRQAVFKGFRDDKELE